MLDFLRKLSELVRPYRFRLTLGVICGVLAGLVEPLMVVVVAFVFAMVFPAAKSVTLDQMLGKSPSLERWVHEIQNSMGAGVSSNTWIVAGVVGLIPAVMFLRGLLGWLNMYFLQWVSVRAVTDLRIRAFSHLLNLSTGFFNSSRSSELISRVMNDTGALQSLLGNTTVTVVKDPVVLVTTMGRSEEHTSELQSR